MTYEVCYLSRALDLLPLYLSILSHPSGLPCVLSICRVPHPLLAVSRCHAVLTPPSILTILSVSHCIPTYLYSLSLSVYAPPYSTELLMAATDGLAPWLLALPHVAVPVPNDHDAAPSYSLTLCPTIDRLVLLVLAPV